MRRNIKLSDQTKQKISRAKKNKKHSSEHKKRISQGMIKYWETISKEDKKGEI